MQVTKTLIAAAGNAGGASGALYSLSDSTKVTTNFIVNQVRIDPSDNIAFQVESRNSVYVPGYTPGYGKIDQDGNQLFYKEFYSTDTTDGYTTSQYGMDVDSSGNIHALIKFLNIFGTGSVIFSGSTGNYLPSTLYRNTTSNNQVKGVVSCPADSAMFACLKTGGTPYTGYVKYLASGDPGNNFIGSKAWAQSSLEAYGPPTIFPVIPSWLAFNFISPYASRQGVLVGWTGSGSSPGYAKSFDTTDSAFTIERIYPFVTIGAPHDVNVSYHFCSSRDYSSGTLTSANVCLLRTDSFYSSSDLLNIYGRFAATGENNNCTMIGFVGDTVTGNEYMYAVLYYYDNVKALTCAAILCFDSSTAALVNQVRISASGTSQNVFAQGQPVIDSEGNVYFCVQGQTLRSTESSIIKLPPGLEISDTTASIFDIEVMNEFALQGQDSIANFYSFTLGTGGQSISSSGGTQSQASKTLSVTKDTI